MALHTLRHTVCLARVHSLPCLFDLLQHCRVVDAVFSLNGRSLAVERHIEVLDAYGL